uniref:Uncharacterized protein n=1 Tax=Acrobeloides nanus TaxID=290746 RepID=A0A914EED6_9BILA
MNNPFGELREMNLQDLYTKLQLRYNEFDEWLTTMGLLHGTQFATTAVIPWLLMEEIVAGSTTNPLCGSIIIEIVSVFRASVISTK